MTRLRFKIKGGWANAGSTGWLYATTRINNQRWSLVHFDGVDDPEVYKTESLLVRTEQWMDVPESNRCEVESD